MRWTVDAVRQGGLAEQIAADVRRGVLDGALGDGDRLPTAADLARALQVNPNTVLVAYRQLRTEGLVEFRRGRGVRVRVADFDRAVLGEAVQRLLELAAAHGYTACEVAALVTSGGEASSERGVDS